MHDQCRHVARFPSLERNFVCKSAGAMASSMAMQALKSIQQPRDDYWNFLELIEAPQWIDLTLESLLQGTEGHDSWFYQHHPHHETPLEDLVFSPTRLFHDKDEDFSQDVFVPSTLTDAQLTVQEVTARETIKEVKAKGLPSKVPSPLTDVEVMVKEVPSRETIKEVKGRPSRDVMVKQLPSRETVVELPTKDTRDVKVKELPCTGTTDVKVGLLPSKGTINVTDVKMDSSFEGRGEVKKTEKDHLGSKAKRIQLLPDSRADTASKDRVLESPNAAPRPSDSFSAHLLSTLMARLRTSEEKRSSSKDENPLVDSKLANQMKIGPSDVSTRTPARKSLLRASVAVLPSDKKRGTNKENSVVAARKEKPHASTSPEQILPKKARLNTARKSMPAVEYGRSQGFSMGRSDPPDVVARRKLASKSRRLSQAARNFGLRERRKSVVRISATLLPRVKHEPKGDVDAKGNPKLTLRYEPRLHSTRDIREWEKRSGQQYYSLQPLERVQVNHEISDHKKCYRQT